MKNCIITPTFKGHFKYILDYLKSFQLNAKSKDNFEICFTISKDEAKAFSKITQKFPDLNIKTLFLEDILSHFQIEKTPDELLRKYKKFSFQTLKKFYTMLYLGKEYRFLILDSESILYRPYDIGQLFDDFFEKPFISGTQISKRQKASGLFVFAKENTSFILGKDCDIWFLENFVWFYDFKILSDLFEKYGSPYQMVQNVYMNRKYLDIFEIDLYQTYIYQNLNKYHYNFHDINQILSDYLPPDLLKNYEQLFFNRFNGACGLLERVLLTKENIKYFSDLLKKLHFNIIRCDETTAENYKLQKKFLEEVNPAILAASQDHYFGVKHNKKQLLKIILRQKNITKLKKHLKSFLKPIIWISEPFAIIKYTLKSLIDGIKYSIKMR